MAAELSTLNINHGLLSWHDNSPNESGFILERKTGDSASVDPFIVLDTLAVNLESFEDSTLSETTTYSYRVKAFNVYLESDYSNLASVTTILPYLTSPSNLTAILHPTIINRVLISWQDNSPNELGFILERKIGNSASIEPYIILDTLAANLESFEDSTLSDTTTYTYRLRAFNTFLESGYSNLASITTILSTLDGPQNLTANLTVSKSSNINMAR